MTNKDGISVEETRALIERIESGEIQRNYGFATQQLIDPLARAYLALSEREAAKDAEIARLKGAMLTVIDSTYDQGAARTLRAALTKGQSDAG